MLSTYAVHMETTWQRAKFESIGGDLTPTGVEVIEQSIDVPIPVSFDLQSPI